MSNEERVLTAKAVLSDMGITNLTYLGQGFEGIVFHDGVSVYKVILPKFRGKDSWHSFRHLTFFLPPRNGMREDFKTFYTLDAVMETPDGTLIEKYPYENSVPVRSFTENDAIQFLVESWQKHVLVPDCKKENFVRVQGRIKLIDLDGSRYYDDNMFLNICVRMYLFVHYEFLNGVKNHQFKKIQRSAINNFLLPELVVPADSGEPDIQRFVNRVFVEIIFSESAGLLRTFSIQKTQGVEYVFYSCQELPNLEQLFFEQIKENRYLCDVQIADVLLEQKNTFVPKMVAVGYRKLIPLKERVSLLIKTCAQDVATIEQNIRHIVRQLSFPNTFAEVVVSIDSKRDDFLRQFTDHADFDGVIGIVDSLQKQKVIDRYIVFNPEEAARINSDWFGLVTEQTHSAKNIPVSSQLYAFEQCTGDYILQMDSDVMIGRRDFNHSYLADMLRELQNNERVISVGFNICNTESKPYFGFENGGFVPEVRMGLFHKERLLAMRPLPNSLDLYGRLNLSWYRSAEQAQKEHGVCSIRGGDSRTFYVHPQNYRKTFPYSWMNILDRIEQNEIPSVQHGAFDCAGSFHEWCGPKRNENMVVVSCFKDISLGKFLRMWVSLMSQTFQDFGVILYDDCSSNGCQIFIDHIIRPFKERVTFIKGRTHQAKLQCEYLAIHSYCGNPDSIIVCLDADDALIGNGVLQDLDIKYRLWNVDLTCGRMHQTYRLQPHYRYPVDFTNPRKTGGNVWQHLKTFRKYLFDSIPLSYFKYENTEQKLSRSGWLEKCDDYAMMVPMVEMSSSPYQSEFISYYYERNYQRRDADRELKERCIAEVLCKPPLSARNVFKGRKRFASNREKIEIDITFDCNLKCKGCNRSCGNAPSSECMQLDDIRKFVAESIALGKKWKLINILGGEPTLHTDFLRILELLQTTYADVFYPETIIQVVSNGFSEKTRSLCTQAERFRNVRIDYNSFKTKSTIDYFTPFNDAPCDDVAFKDADYTAACWVASYCGICLTKNGYYACASCGSIDRVQKGRRGVASLAQLTDEKCLEHFMAFCKYCGNFKHYAESNGDFILRCEKAPFVDTISPTWKELYAAYNNE